MLITALFEFRVLIYFVYDFILVCFPGLDPFVLVSLYWVFWLGRIVDILD